MWFTTFAALLLYAFLTALSNYTKSSKNSERCTKQGPNSNCHENSVPSPDSLSSELPDSITTSSEDLIDRGEWVRRIANYVHYDRHKGHYNVIVINNDIEYRLNAERIVEEFHVKYFEMGGARVVPYRIVAFEKGVMINLGDGGYINWCGVGNETRSGVTTLKFEPCVTGDRRITAEVEAGDR
jgi:hypothetical protein